MSANLAAIRPHFNAYDPQYVAREAEATYAAIVEDVEREKGVALPNLKSIRFTLDMPADRDEEAQLPYGRWFQSLQAKPFWELDDLTKPMRTVFVSLKDAFPRLREEFLNTHTPAQYVDGHTGYTGKVKTWRHRVVLDADMTFTEDGMSEFPTLCRLLRPLADRKILRKGYFAMMRAGSDLPNHCGGTNLFLRLHLGVIVPDGDLALKVGGETRRWQEGDTLLFDDSFGHEAWNRSERDRYVLLLRFMHPAITDDELQWFSEVSGRFNRTEAGKAVFEVLRELGFLGE